MKLVLPLVFTFAWFAFVLSPRSHAPPSRMTDEQARLLTDLAHIQAERALCRGSPTQVCACLTAVGRDR